MRREGLRPYLYFRALYCSLKESCIGQEQAYCSSLAKVSHWLTLEAVLGRACPQGKCESQSCGIWRPSANFTPCSFYIFLHCTIYLLNILEVYKTYGSRH